MKDIIVKVNLTYTQIFNSAQIIIEGQVVNIRDIKYSFKKAVLSTNLIFG